MVAEAHSSPCRRRAGVPVDVAVCAGILATAPIKYTGAEFNKAMITALQYLADRGCNHKVYYQGPKRAARAAERLYKNTGALVEAYECHQCGGWHVGHKDRTSLALLQK